MPLDLGDYASALAPAFGLIAEAHVEPLHVVRWATERSLEQICKPLLKNLIGRDVAPNFYPVATGVGRLLMPSWAVIVTVRGAERSAADRLVAA